MTKDHWYRGYLIEKPEGCDYWNIREVDSNGIPDWCFTVGNAINLKEARETIDYLIEEQWKEYPGVKESERERIRVQYSVPQVSEKQQKKLDELPDFIGSKPNYDKFKEWDTERALVWLNID